MVYTSLQQIAVDKEKKFYKLTEYHQHADDRLTGSRASFLRRVHVGNIVQSTHLL
jgi:hypothetical protein